MILVVASMLALLPADHESVHRQAMAAYKKADFVSAARLFGQELELLAPGELGGPVELSVRERLVLALFAAGAKREAADAYRALKAHFADFHFDEDLVSPATIQFFAKIELPAASHYTPATSQPSAPRTEPSSQITTLRVQPPDTKPKLIAAPAMPVAQWHWYYLMPLGIGEYTAGSPVRGTLLLVAELGCIALNASGYVLYHNQLAADGGARNVNAALTGQTLMNVGFFGLIGALAVGFIDGLLLEPVVGGASNRGKE